ncbi:MAG: MFS transporter [Salinibacterium sp.]|nr:MFS transporter [Salinibacterium sp.]
MTILVDSGIRTRRQTLGMVTAGFGQNFVLTTVSTFMLVYLLQYAMISTAGIAVVTLIITVAKIADAILDPVMGSIIDMTRTRWGKFRPYILFSALPVAILSGLLFSVPDTSEPLKLVFFGICYALWGLAYTVCDVPFWGLIGSAFSEPTARTRVIGLVRAFGAIALGLSTLGMPWLARLLSFGPETTSRGWSLAVFVTSLLGMSLFTLAFFRTRERTSVTATARLTVRELFSTLGRNTPPADGPSRLGARVRTVHRAGRWRGVRGHCLRRRGDVHAGGCRDHRRDDHRLIRDTQSAAQSLGPLARDR